MSAHLSVTSTPGLPRAKAFIEDARELTCQYSDLVARQVGQQPAFVHIDLPASTLDCLLLDIEAGEQLLRQEVGRRVDAENRRAQAERLLHVERYAFTTSLLAVSFVLFAAFSYAYGGGW